MTHSQVPSTRAALICGPYLSGKTTLMEALLAEAGTISRHRTQSGAFAVADGSPEARAHGMSTELNVASSAYLDEKWTFLDCPGSVELLQDTRSALSVADVAIVVVEPDPAKAPALSTYLRLLDDLSVPHLLFINKLDKEGASVRVMMEALQGASGKPLVLREIPIRDGEHITGHVDLVSERAFHWEEGKPSNLIKMPDAVSPRESEARTELFESLADFDDTLLEKLLEDVVPSSDEVYENLTRDLTSNLVVPVFFGSALHGNGVRRLMKALRHESPDVSVTTERLGLPTQEALLARVFKTQHAGHAGKLSLARVMKGTFKSGDTLNGERPAGINRMFGQKMEAVTAVETGDIVAFTKLDKTETGDVLTGQGKLDPDGITSPPAPLYSLAIASENRGDDVKLPDNLRKVIEEDPSLVSEFDNATGEHVLRGQGDLHLKLALEKLKNRAGLVVNSTPPKVAYRETLRRKVEKRVRHKKQSGGHGEFGEVQVRVSPLPHGEGFRFNDAIHGGVVPRQYIPAVQAGIEDAMSSGPLGFRVVDVEVTLFDGKAHPVDSSEMAFRKAGGQAMRDALSEGGSVLLEPINSVKVMVPSAFISSVQKAVLGRRGQIFGYEAKEGWIGWDQLTSQIPASEMHDFIMEIRSVTQGTGTFEAQFDHLQELSGKEVDKIVAREAVEAT